MTNRNKALIISCIAMLIVAGASFVIGGWLAGWDFVAFFQSPTFVWILVMIGIYILCVVAVLVSEKIGKL